MTGSPKVFGYGYGPNSTTEYARFNSNYYSGSDVRIYFGDIWLDEITSIQYDMQENVAPIYGYASFTWDKVARGSRQIQGAFRINFKESYYLHNVMNKLNDDSLEDPDSDTDGIQEETANSAANIEQILSQTDSTEFDKLAEEFEKSMWGESINSTILREKSNRKSGAYFHNHKSQSNLSDGFSIIIHYGPYNQTGSESVPRTTQSLVGVQITGVSQIIGGDGRPVEEQYSFIARDLNTTMEY